MIEGDHGIIRIDQGDASYWAVWIMAVLIFFGAVIILGYNLLPEGSFSKVWGSFTGAEDDGVQGEQGKWTRAYYEPPSQSSVPLYAGAAMTNVV